MISNIIIIDFPSNKERIPTKDRKEKGHEEAKNIQEEGKKYDNSVESQDDEDDRKYNDKNEN